MLIRIGLVVAAAIVTLVELSAVARPTLAALEPSRPPCPIRQRAVSAHAAHFEPGLVQHQNWLVFSVPERYRARRFVVCYAGYLREVGAEPVDRTTADALVYVKTRQVDLEWLFGRLDAFRQPERWSLGYDVQQTSQ